MSSTNKAVFEGDPTTDVVVRPRPAICAIQLGNSHHIELTLNNNKLVNREESIWDGVLSRLWRHWLQSNSPKRGTIWHELEQVGCRLSWPLGTHTIEAIIDVICKWLGSMRDIGHLISCYALNDVDDCRLRSTSSYAWILVKISQIGVSEQDVVCDTCILPVSGISCKSRSKRFGRSIFLYLPIRSANILRLLYYKACRILTEMRRNEGKRAAFHTSPIGRYLEPIHL